MTLINFVLLILRSPKTWLDKCLKSPASEAPSKSSMVNGPKNCWNLHHSIFIIFIDLCQGNWFRESLSYWYVKSWGCFLTHWLLLASILALIGTTNDTNSDAIISERKMFFARFCCILKSRINFKDFEKKDDPHRFCISETMDSEKVVR